MNVRCVDKRTVAPHRTRRQSVDRATDRSSSRVTGWPTPFDNFVDDGGYVSYNTYAIVGVGG